MSNLLNSGMIQSAIHLDHNFWPQIEPIINGQDFTRVTVTEGTSKIVPMKMGHFFATSFHIWTPTKPAKCALIEMCCTISVPLPTNLFFATDLLSLFLLWCSWALHRLYPPTNSYCAKYWNKSLPLSEKKNCRIEKKVVVLLLFWGFSAILGVVGRIYQQRHRLSRTTAVEVAIKQGSNSHVSIGEGEREWECMHAYICSANIYGHRKF